MNRWYPRLLLLAAAAGWGSATTATKFALEGFGPVTMLFVKLAAAAAVLWAVLLVRGHRPTGGTGRLALLGLFEPTLAYAGLTIGLLYTTASNASLIGATEPALVLILAAIFLKEPLRGRSLLGLTVAVGGVVVLEGGNLGAGLGLGDLIVLGGSAAAAVYVLLARKVAPTVDALTMTAYQFTYATLFTLPAAASQWALGNEAFPTTVAWPYWLAAVSVGGVLFAGSFVLYNHAITKVPAGLAGMALNLIPIFGVLTAVAFLGELLTGWHLAGMVAIIGGVMLSPAAQPPPIPLSTPQPPTPVHDHAGVHLQPGSGGAPAAPRQPQHRPQPPAGSGRAPRAASCPSLALAAPPDSRSSWPCSAPSTARPASRRSASGTGPSARRRTP